MVILLVEAGANVRASTTARPRSQIPGGPPNRPPEYSSPIPAYTPLDIATGYKHNEVADYLKSELNDTPKKQLIKMLFTKKDLGCSSFFVTYRQARSIVGVTEETALLSTNGFDT